MCVSLFVCLFGCLFVCLLVFGLFVCCLRFVVRPLQLVGHAQIGRVPLLFAWWSCTPVGVGFVFVLSFLLHLH